MRKHIGFHLSATFVLLSALVACSAVWGEQIDECPYAGKCETGGAGGSGGSPSGGSSGQGGTSSGSGGTGGDGGIAGTSGSAGEAGGGGGDCDETKSPLEETCLVSSEYAIFVAPSGDDGAAGSKAAPVATLTKAVELAADDKIVIVCNAEYDEHVEIKKGARVYGGFSCSDWSTDADSPLFKPSSAGAALKIDEIDVEVVIENVAFEVPDAMGAGASAVSAIVNASPNVTLRSVSLKAGKGLAGDDGTLMEFTYSPASELNGYGEADAENGASKTCACQGTLKTSGGIGGAPVDGGQNGSTGQPNHGGGQGGIPGSCSPDGGGKDGFEAPDQGPADGAQTLGTASPDAWLPTPGGNGATGQPGQGGGGGASRNDLGHGGGGGCGGCGGNGGAGGQGGGGSIALLLIDSPITLESCTLTTSDAGDGGNGAAGQPGQQEVGSGGLPISTLNSCGGGNGGKGGDGGAGGGGAGGISVAIVWRGETAPTVSDDTMTTFGEAGLPGEGGAADNDGIAGVAQEVLEL